MAKGSTARGGGPSRIRFILVEADLQEGDLAQVTQVLQNAFRTSQVIPAPPQAARIASALPRSDDQEPEDAVSGDIDDLDEEAVPVAPRQARKPRLLGCQML